LVCSQLVSYFIKISALYYGIIYLYMNVFHYVCDIYRLIEYLEYSCLLVISMHVVRYFILCVFINFRKGISKRRNSKGGIEGSVSGLWVAGCVTQIDIKRTNIMLPRAGRSTK
jgi:hypothetical protein